MTYMRKQEGDSSALFLAPEPPHPRVGGGALRSSTLLEYLQRGHDIDAITFAERGVSVIVPGARNVWTIKLPHHSRSPLARAWRNLLRFARGAPPLLDRFSGFEADLGALLSGQRYDVAVIEHFWCAPYGALLRSHAGRLILDLHNIESELQEWIAVTESWPLSMMFRRFADAYRRLEREWLPVFDDVLVPSHNDARHIKEYCSATVYPNAIPFRPHPRADEENAIAFSGNLEYHPNVAAIRYFAAQIWPLVHAARPGIEWRLIGRNPHAIERIVAKLPDVRIIGPVDDAIEALARAKVVVAPLLAGSGTRFKIIEAWAAARAVVSTTVGAEGLDARDGEHLRIEDDPGSFAGAVIDLLDSPEDRAELGASGRALYLDRFTTEAAWRVLEAIGL